MWHNFEQDIEGITLPEQFTYPFCYTPHPLSILAAEQVRSYIATQKAWHEELSAGKMFGVLIVEDSTHNVGFLAAFSGNLAGTNRLPYFVPPIYDMLQQNDFFKIEEAHISQINKHLQAIENHSQYRRLKIELNDLRQKALLEIEQMKRSCQSAKQQRDARRKQPCSEEERTAMNRESQFMKAELKRTSHKWSQIEESLSHKIEIFASEIEALKSERKERSAILQQKIFAQFKLRNFSGEERDLCSVFMENAGKMPPAGTGECCAPKLLQYAAQNQWKPLAMAEFWWGASPRGEIRRDGQFYASCQSKCKPILGFMMQGLDVEQNPLSQLGNSHQTTLQTIFEDPWLIVVNKPAGLLSVAGKEALPSIESIAKKQYPSIESPMMVHRLDMDTSGLLVLAKDKRTHQLLQAEFQSRNVKKRYIALLNGIISQKEGQIDLPLCLDPEDRPRQIVHDQLGKEAITRFKVLAIEDRYTRIAFYPITGRTHQLRVHAAHPDGLNCPILGDRLYGKADKRLFLHAEKIGFTHPFTHKEMVFELPADF